MTDEIIELTDADVVEEFGDDLLTGDQAQEAVRERDHQIAVNTAQELIRQRGILMQDLEDALNMCRRYRGVLKANALPDPCAARLAPLLEKYGMTGKRPVPPDGWTPTKEREIADQTVGRKQIAAAPIATISTLF